MKSLLKESKLNELRTGYWSLFEPLVASELHLMTLTDAGQWVDWVMKTRASVGRFSNSGLSWQISKLGPQFADLTLCRLKSPLFPYWDGDSSVFQVYSSHNINLAYKQEVTSRKAAHRMNGMSRIATRQLISLPFALRESDVVKDK